MTRTFTHYDNIEVCPDDDRYDYEVEVVYTFIPGSRETPPCYHHGGLPADPPEVEIQDVYRLMHGEKRGEPVELSDADEKRIHQYIMEHHEPEERE